MIEISTEGRVRRVTLNRPEKRNALTRALCESLVAAFDEAGRDDSIGTILLTANGPAFCAGMDLEEALSADLGELGRAHELLFTQIDRLRKPLIAGVRGAALGGGTGLVANAHIVVAAPDARFGLTEIRIGLWPVLILRPVTLAIGERRATELSLTGRIFGAAEAVQYGLATEIAADADERAAEIARMVAGHSGHAIGPGLEYIRAIRQTGWEAAGEMGRRLRDRLMTNEDFKSGVRGFLTKRPRA